MSVYSQARLAAVLGLCTISVAALPIGAFAQTTPSPMAHANGAPSETALLKGMSKNVEAHIAALHTQLKITPSEETQWAAFAQVMRDNAAQMDAAFTQRGQTIETMNAVQDLQSYAQIAQVQSDNMQKLAAAFQTLYASFPASQQKLADAVFRPKAVRQ
jgi:protein CpxP